MARSLCVGVLALQGAFAKHQEMLDEIGVVSKEVKRPKDLEGCDALIIPGGESPTFFRQIDWCGLTDPLNAFSKEKPTFGTCAGLILMSKEIDQQTVPAPFGWLDITVKRNAWGRQVESFKTEIPVDLPTGKIKLNAIFIRAPRILRVGNDVKVLARYKGEPVLVQRGKHLGATFHPELAKDPALHRYFIKLIQTR